MAYINDFLELEHCTIVNRAGLIVIISLLSHLPVYAQAPF
jgi:hypothetical protein